MGFQSDQGASVLRRTRTAAACLAAVVAATGCDRVDEPEVAEPGTVAGFAGVVAADEPRAAQIGREILGNNGNAIDAAVAMGFAMSVTLPSRVGLGGGGACVIHRHKDKRQDALVFLPPIGSRQAAVPVMARGLAALHARHGLSRWESVVRPAEELAGQGHEVSRAFRTDLVAGRDRLGPEARSIYLRADGSVPDVGMRFRQTALGTALAGLRQRGASYLVTGDFARRVSAGARAAGVDLTVADLRNAVPRYDDPLTAPFGDHTLLLPPEPVTAGRDAAAAWAALDGKGLGAAGSPRRWQRLLGAWRTDGAAGGDEPPDPGGPSAGLAVADRFGNLAACGFTMNGLFGTGRMAEGTGVLLARAQPPDVAGRALLPALIANPYTGAGYMALHAGAERGAAATLTQTLASLRAGGGASLSAKAIRKMMTDAAPGAVERSKENPPDSASARAAGAPADVGALLRAARAAPVAGTRVMRHEPGLPEPVRAALRQKGYTLEQVPRLGRISVVHCPGGARDAPTRCTASADPRGHGMAVIAR